MSRETDADDLRRRIAPLEMSGEQFRDVGHALVDRIADFLDGLRSLPVNREESLEQVRELLPPDALPEEGVDAGELLAGTARLLFDHSLFNGHPRFFGYITSSAAPIGALADLLASTVNANMGAWHLSPVASEIERQTVRWIAQLIGFPSDCGGLFVSGGNVANFVCFLAARQAKVPWNFRDGGIRGGNGRPLIYASSEAHTWIQKAVNLFGHGADAMRAIPTDTAQRVDVDALRARIEADRADGDHPFLIVATGGTVGTGAIDPIRAMITVARDTGTWLHVDGAYGALAAALPEADSDLKALSDADSVAVDPHKWLYAPLEAGCALVRDPEALLRTFSYRPPYYHFHDEDEPRLNFYEHGLQNSRGFRALKVWIGIRQVGRAGIVRMIRDDIRLAGELQRRVEAHRELEVASQCLSIVAFRYVPADLSQQRRDGDYLDRLNEALLDRLQSSGEAYPSNAIVNGRFALRACIINFRTSLEDVEALPEIVVRHGRELHDHMRHGSP